MVCKLNVRHPNAGTEQSSWQHSMQEESAHLYKQLEMVQCRCFAPPGLPAHAFPELGPCSTKACCHAIPMPLLLDNDEMHMLHMGQGNNTLAIGMIRLTRMLCTGHADVAASICRLSVICP